MSKQIAALFLSTSVAALAVSASAGAQLAPAPSVKIGSTRGTGAGGCVQSAKRVRFSLDGGTSYIWPTAATVTLDGKVIATKSWGIVAAAFPQSAQKKSFVVRVSLARKAAGRHRLRLIGNFVEIFNRKSGAARAAAPATLTGSASKRITKCAAFTG